MARRWFSVFRPGSTLLRILVCFTLSCLIAVASGTAVNAKPTAAGLTRQGHAYLNQGQPKQAYDAWVTAMQLYKDAENREGVIGSAANQSLALQMMGHHVHACLVLTQTLSISENLCKAQPPNRPSPEEAKELLAPALQQPTSATAIGLHSLGDSLRPLGNPESSAVILQAVLAMEQRYNRQDIPFTLLSLGNTERALYQQARDRYELSDDLTTKPQALEEALKHLRSSLDFYQQAEPSLVEARLNHLSLLVDLARWYATTPTLFELQNLSQQAQQQIPRLLQQLQQSRVRELPAIPAIHAKLNLAGSLLRLNETPALRALLGKEDVAVRVRQLAQAALKESRAIQNSRSQSHALGILGQTEANPAQARRDFALAVSLAQLQQAWDLAFQWQARLAQTYEQLGDLEQAGRYYEAAADSLDQVRADLLAVNPDIQLSFRESVQPVYQNLIKVLLGSPQPNLKAVVRTQERLRLAELENYLQCGKLNLASLSEVQDPEQQSAIIHLLDLGDRLVEIVRSPQGQYHAVWLDRQQVLENADNLLRYLQDPRLAKISVQQFLPFSQSLYEALIVPAQPYLQSKTLVFALDERLQNIPMHLLHNGTDYLLKDYNISVVLGGQVRPPQRIQLHSAKALIAGLSQSSPSFTAVNVPQDLIPLPEVEAEVRAIARTVGSPTELLNQTFTTERLQKQFTNQNYPILHLSTHGVFSSDPQKTMLLAWDQAMNVQELKEILAQGTEAERRSLELLVLSACETARGDRRSALGIAGVATQVGARSTLASLWLVDAASTAELMERFYQNLNAGQPKAEALRQAQLALMSKPQWQHPYYWSAFILVGSWL